jgi:transcriptional regulator with XRE-family HTH domain
MKKCVGYMRPVKKNIVRKLRVWKNLRQTDVAYYLNMTISIYRRLENNERRLKPSEQYKLAELFGVRESQLYEEEEK